MTMHRNFIPVPGKTNQQLADQYGVSVRTISRWKAEFNARFNSTPTAETTDVEAPQQLEPVELVVPEQPAQYHHIVSPAFVNIVRQQGSNVETVVFQPSDPNYQKAVDSINAGDDLSKFFIRAQIELVAIQTKGEVTIDINGIHYKGFDLKGPISDAILEAYNDGRLTASSQMVLFLDNLVQNPDSQVFDQLYPFMKHNDIEVSDDGHLIAYKKVRDTYFDIHSNTMRNQPGDILEMPRVAVANDPNQTCAAGLHVCAKAYLSKFGSGISDRVVKIKVNPRDVVSVPVDYNGAKMRVCRYEVIEDVTAEYEQN